MKASTTFYTAALFAWLHIPFSNCLSIAPSLSPPYTLRIHTLGPLNNTLVQTPTANNYGLSIQNTSHHDNNPWDFEISAGYELSNDTTLLILLGEKVYMWDPEPASMQLFAEPKAVAKTGWPGTPWPSVYISAKWDFNITRDERGRWMLGHGFEHGMWISQPDTVAGDGRWGLYWWNGTATYGVGDEYVPVSIEVVSSGDLGGDEGKSCRGRHRKKEKR